MTWLEYWEESESRLGFARLVPTLTARIIAPEQCLGDTQDLGKDNMKAVIKTYFKSIFNQALHRPIAVLRNQIKKTNPVDHCNMIATTQRNY